MGWITFIVAVVFCSSAYAAVEKKDPAVVLARKAEARELFETLSYPARVTAKVNAAILAEIDGVVTRIHAPLGSRVGRRQGLLTIRHTDPVYDYAPVGVTSPVAGVVSGVEVTEGSRVIKGQRLASVTDPRTVQLSVEVPATDLGSIRAGLDGVFKVRGRDGEVPVRVRGVSPFVDPATGTATCELELVGGKGEELPPGVVGRADFKANRRQGISIPEHAVVYKGRDTFLRLVEAGKARLVPVSLGRTSSGSVEVLGGLPSGAEVIERSSRFVADGDVVKVEAEETPKRGGA